MMSPAALLIQAAAQASGEFMKSLPEIIKQASSSPLGILALIIIALALLGWVFFRDAAEKTRVAIFVGLFVAAVMYGKAVMDASASGTGSLHRVRVIVLDAGQTPVNDAKVRSSLGGEALKVDGGWQFDVPDERIQAGNKVTFYASTDAPCRKATSEVPVTTRNQTVTLKLERCAEVTVRGIVQDAAGSAIEGAQVSVIGYGEEAVITKADGNFVLPAHASDGQSTQLHVERHGCDAVNQYQPAGDQPAVLVLQCRKRR